METVNTAASIYLCTDFNLTRMGLCAVAVRYILWMIFLRLFLLFRYVIWSFTGTRSRINISRCKESYRGTAQVLSIWLRHRIHFSIHLGRNDFITTHSSWQDPEYVLSPNITLYFVTKEEAIFIEAEKDIDVYESKHSCFVNISQFNAARKLVILPLHVFHKLADNLGAPKAQLIVIVHTSRCGSTLLTQLIEETRNTTTISSPKILNPHWLRNTFHDTEYERIVLHIVYLMCKPGFRQIGSYALKLRGEAMRIIPCLKQLFPQAKLLFMYREGLPTARSINKLTRTQPVRQLLSFFLPYSQFIRNSILDMMEVPRDIFNFKNISPFTISVLFWARNIKYYNDFRLQGINITAVKYEDIIADPHVAFGRVLEHFKLSYNPLVVDEVMSRDSQQNSPMSKADLDRLPAENFTQDVKLHSDIICDYFGISRIPEIYIAPGTITNNSKNKYS